MKIAWFTPFSRASAIGRYSALIVDELARQHEVVVYASDLKTARGAWRPGLPLRFLPGRATADVVAGLGRFDLAVYNLGNNLAFHRLVYAAALAWPGLVILHDLALGDFFNHLYLLDAGRERDFVAHMGFSHGEEGRLLAWHVLEQRRRRLEFRPDPLAYSMARSGVHRAVGVVVHGESQRRALAEVAPCPVAHIDFPAPDLPPPPPRPADTGRLQLLTFGQVVPARQVHLVFEALAQSPMLRGRVEYHVVGACPLASYRRELEGLIARRGLGDVVRLHGRAPEAELYARLYSADVIVNLRNPDAGEGSWSLLEGLFAGRPTVVWKRGYYDEFPDDVVRKVSSAEQLRQALEELCGDAGLREQLGGRAGAYARSRFDTARYCREFLAFAEACVSARPALLFVDAVSERLRELCGPDPEAAPARAVRDEIERMLGLGAA